MKIPHVNLIPQSPSRLGFLLIPVALACFGLSPQARALNPPPDGGYPGGNTAEGRNALFSLTAGLNNTAVGFRALFANDADSNTAVGAAALLRNHGTLNTAVGTDAMVDNNTGSYNTAVGAFALAVNIDGYNNNAFGYQAAGALQTGYGNNVFGYYALGVNNSGAGNNAFGAFNLGSNPTGSYNTAVGDQALRNNYSGDSNTALGAAAGYSLLTGSNNIYIGDAGFFEESNAIAIGAASVSGVPYQNTYIGGIYDSIETDRGVYVGSNGHLGTLASSGRYKEEIKPMDKASDALFRLKPVTFRYKQQIDPAHKLSFGLIAEDVAKVSPDLISCDKEGKPYTVRYEAVNAMLLNEFLKEHRKNEEQQSKIEQQETKIAVQQKQIEALSAGLQRVSTQLELSKSTPQTVKNTD